MTSLVNNQRAYEYNKAINHELKAICKPFMDSLGTTGVAYHRIYSDGKAVSIGTNYEILRHYYSYVQDKGLFFQKHLGQIKKNKPFYYLWPNKIESYLHEIIQQVGVWNGFNLYIRGEDYIENYVLTGSLHSTELQNYCLNNLDLINSLAGYFKEAAQEFIYNVDERDMVFFNCQYSLISNTSETQKLSSLNMKKIPFCLGNAKIYLTNREALCLSYICSGYSIKEIALKLKISSRTIESHIATVRMKTGISFKSKFIDLINIPENAIIKNLRYFFESEFEM